ncbi:uncharacterized protein LY89DRAFT_737875 [Mollisia scopiformis]|uniref:Uncharacterized protein n=1 Tax=Mollisia scopiformis TaxID=149040 RepID=A0A194WZ46_MOLSC|nr:uncharacterized protein LY89DRAFT_737875 [Mollisia scopiformis]KUJ12974.1 hypothetical protein LY89DRAFT_737875 [Mollisia scopiformis]
MASTSNPTTKQSSIPPPPILAETMAPRSSKTWNRALTLPRPSRKLRTTFSKTRKPLTLTRFPAEIRENIFSRCISIVDPRRSPNLIIALRGHPLLYAEVLRAFYRLNVFVICRDTLKTWERLGKNTAVLEMVRWVDVVALTPHQQVKFNILPGIFKPVFGKNQIERLNFTVSTDVELSKRVAKVLKGFPNLKYVGVWIRSVIYGVEERGKMDRAMDVVDKAIGVKRKMSTVSATSAEHWFWEHASRLVLPLPGKEERMTASKVGRLTVTKG